ncbi:hypothetical protein JW916_11930 [Candidatus Sumerlaeota bacterium]|nr:hypothetical protein [Candidatus Sumerlaeota bacterium]
MVNWLITADVPKFRDMTRAEYFARLDAMTEQVRRDMEMMRPVVESRGGDPDTPHARCNIFCGAMVRLGLAYREEFRHDDLTLAQMGDLYEDADNVFLAGLLRTGRGSCVSMPLVYLVIGGRLGLPIHLVAVGKHYFIRWEEPGYRMNIESTIVERVCMTPEDSVYLKTEGATRAQLKGSEMRNLTNREAVGQIFFTREGYWATQGPEHQEQCLCDLSRARLLAPDDPAIEAAYKQGTLQFGFSEGE